MDVQYKELDFNNKFDILFANVINISIPLTQLMEIGVIGAVGRCVRKVVEQVM